LAGVFLRPLPVFYFSATLFWQVFLENFQMFETNTPSAPIEPKRTKWKTILGYFFIVVGFVALITPLTPGAWLIPVGLGLIGVRLAFWEKLKARFFKRYKK
jgi:hypothetical protein